MFRHAYVNRTKINSSSTIIHSILLTDGDGSGLDHYGAEIFALGLRMLNTSSGLPGRILVI